MMIRCVMPTARWIGVLAIGIDISERLEVQKHLQQSEERYALAVRGDK